LELYTFCFPLALYLAERNRHAEALVLWQKAVDLSPLDFDITFNLASALRHVGRNKEAIYRYETAAKLSPEVYFEKF